MSKGIAVDEYDLTSFKPKPKSKPKKPEVENTPAKSYTVERGGKIATFTEDVWVGKDGPELQTEWNTPESFANISSANRSIAAFNGSRDAVYIFRSIENKNVTLRPWLETIPDSDVALRARPEACGRDDKFVRFENSSGLHDDRNESWNKRSVRSYAMSRGQASMYVQVACVQSEKGADSGIADDAITTKSTQVQKKHNRAAIKGHAGLDGDSKGTSDVRDRLF